MHKLWRSSHNTWQTFWLTALTGSHRPQALLACVLAFKKGSLQRGFLQVSVIPRWFRARLSPLLCNGRRLHCSGTMGIRSPLREAVWGPQDAVSATGLKSASGEQLHNFKGILPPCFSLSSGLDTRLGRDLWVWPFRSYKRKEPWGTSRAWDLLHRMLGLEVSWEVNWHDGYYFWALKSKTIPAIKDFVPKGRSQHHIHKILSQVQHWNHPMQEMASTRVKITSIHAT